MAHLNGSRQPKAIVWAHNSHLGDARATEMSERGELNVGQLIRERFENEAVLIGFTTHEGSVTGLVGALVSCSPPPNPFDATGSFDGLGTSVATIELFSMRYSFATRLTSAAVTRRIASISSSGD